MNEFIQQVFRCGPITRFPGGHPTSLYRKDLERVCGRTDDLEMFVMSPKLDGERRFIIIFGGNVVSMDRAARCTVFNLNVHQQACAGTILDVEIYKDTVYIFDLIVIHGNSLHLNYLHRLDLAAAFVDALPGKHIKVSTSKPAVCRLSGCQQQDFRIITKPVFSLDLVPLYATLLPSSEDTDGIVFTRVECPYQLGRSDNILKWKPSHSIDARIRRDCETIDNSVPMSLWSTGEYSLRADNGIVFGRADSYMDDFSDTTIVEVEWWNGNWAILRQRVDKLHANSELTVRRTLENIVENVSFTELCAAVNQEMYSP